MTTTDVRNHMAELIWKTSRADESTISYAGANVIADALIAAGFGHVASVERERDDLMALAVEDTRRRGEAIARAEAAEAQVAAVRALLDRPCPVEGRHSTNPCECEVFEPGEIRRAIDGEATPAEPDADERSLANGLAVVLARVRCQVLHRQTNGGRCINCISWAENIGVPEHLPRILASRTPDAHLAADFRDLKERIAAHCEERDAALEELSDTKAELADATTHLAAAKAEGVLRLTQHLVSEVVDGGGRCSLTADGGGRCTEPDVAVRWEDGFADVVCERHAETARERGALIVVPARHDGTARAARLREQGGDA